MPSASAASCAARCTAFRCCCPTHRREGPAHDRRLDRAARRELNAYLAAVPGEGAKSLGAIIAYNDAHAAEGLKYQQGELLAAQAVDLSDPATAATYAADKAAGRASSRALIDGLLDNGTPGDNSDDLDVIAVPTIHPTAVHALIGIADRAGYPTLTVPAGYGTGSAGRNPIGITFVGPAFGEAKLLAAGYAFEQATDVRLAPSWTNPSMWRCVAGSTFHSPHHCYPGDLIGDYPFGLG